MQTNRIPARVRGYAAAFLVAVALASPASAAAGDARSSAAVANISAIRIDNFGQVDASLFRGAQPEGRDYADLKALGVKTIVNLTSDDAEANEQADDRSGGHALRRDSDDHARGADARPARAVPRHRERSGEWTGVCALRRGPSPDRRDPGTSHDEGWTGQQAFSEMKQYKFGADFLHSEFKDFVYGYHPDVRPAAATTATSASVQR